VLGSFVLNGTSPCCRCVLSTQNRFTLLGFVVVAQFEIIMASLADVFFAWCAGCGCTCICCSF
jgi:hypothetical protein